MSERHVARRSRGSYVKPVELLEPRRLLSGEGSLRITPTIAAGAWEGSGIISSPFSLERPVLGRTENGAVITMPKANAAAASFSFEPGLITGSNVSGGTVHLGDFNSLAANTGASIWTQSDFNYDGNVNLADFNSLASNFGTSQDWTNLVPSTVPPPPPSPVPVPTFAITRGGTLNVTGTKNADSIVIDASVIAQVSAEYRNARVLRVHVDVGAGDDSVEMRVSLPSTLVGGRGNDHLIGGSRADHISGGAGNDFVDAGSGNDLIEGLGGNDSLNGSAGADLLLGGNEPDRLTGGSGDDTLRGGAHDDVCFGGDGNDLLYGDAGVDMLYGGAGRNRYKSADGTTDHVFPSNRSLDRILAADADDDLKWGVGIG